MPLQRASVRQASRFAIAGTATAVTYFAVTLLLAGPVDVAIQIAIPLGYVTSLCVHFSLQRFFVFRSHRGFALALHHQLGRYLAISLSQYGLTAASTAVLPEVLDVDERIVYVVTALVLAAVVFVLLRTAVFRHAEPAETSRPTSR